MRPRVKLEGAEAIKAALAELGKEVSTKIGVKANRDAAALLKDELVERVPYDTTVHKDRPYGHLRDNIRVRRAKARKQGHIVFLVTVGNAFWGRFLEFGTLKMPARPFMRPTFDRMLPQLRQAQVDGLRAGIDRAVKRIARANKKKQGG